jgi:hypothetical protein
VRKNDEKTLEMEGQKLPPLGEFVTHFSERVLSDYPWAGNLKACNDILRRGF